MHSRSRETAEFLGFSGPIIGQRDYRPQASWRTERNCRQTLSGAISKGYEPHTLRWMLTRESGTAFAVSTPRTRAGASARNTVLDSGLEQGGNIDVVVRRDPVRKMPPVLSSPPAGVRISLHYYESRGHDGRLAVDAP